MINLYNQVPTIYTRASRDFQYLCWLINIVLNSVKHNVDDLYNLRSAKDPAIGQLLALTLGFKTKRNYDQKQLSALVSVIPGILKYKGTEKAITMAGEALINASGSQGSFSCEVNGSTLEVTIPKDLVDTTLFIDLLPYILPAGMTCRITKRTQVKEKLDPTELSFKDKLRYGMVPELVWNDSTKAYTGLSSMFSLDDQSINLANFNIDDPNRYGEIAENTLVDLVNLVNTGLLDNAIIAALDTNQSQLNTSGEEEE
jgi:hypothetical protein